MKSRSGFIRYSRSRSLSTNAAFYTYLKPGDLARLRDSKITARSRQTAAQTVLASIQLNQVSDSVPNSPDLAADGFPCFRSRSAVKFPRCIQRKNLVAVTPFFRRVSSS